MIHTSRTSYSPSFLRVTRTFIVSGAMLGSLPSLQATQLFDGMVAYWPLDEGAGDLATDGFGMEVGTVEDHGTVRNSPIWLEDGSALLGSSALFFGGTDAAQDVLIPNSLDLDITTNAASISAWVNILRLPSDLFEPFAGIYDSSQDSYIMYLDRNNRELRFKVTDSSGTAERPGVPESMLVMGAWHHVLGVYNGEDKAAKIYFDGQLVDTHLNGGFGDPVRTGQIASIGANPSADPGNASIYFFEGAIDDLAVWNRPLGQAEATYLFNDGRGTAVGAANPDIAFLPDGVETVIPIAPRVDPVVHYRFEGTLTNDGTGGSALDGTLSDTPGVNDGLYGVGTDGLGLDLRENPDSAEGGDSLFVDYELTENGTIVFDYEVDKFYNFQSLWTNSVNANDWEMWIYDDGRLRARVEDDSVVTYDLTVSGGLDETYKIAFTWERNEEQVEVKLYVDGERRDLDTGSWVDPGTRFFIGGGDGVNDLGAGIWDDFRIYDAALTAGEVLFLSSSFETNCDHDGNGSCDIADIDMLVAEIAAGTNNASFDLNGDASVDKADLVEWLSAAAQENGLSLPYLSGDADLSGTVDANDLNAMALNWQENVTTWSGGDFTADGMVTPADLNELALNWRRSIPSAASPEGVPEPSTEILLLFAVASMVFKYRIQ